MSAPELSLLIFDTVAKLREPLGLDRWQINFESGKVVDDETGEEIRAACTASPEYSEATLYFNFDQIKTGDDIVELVVHELTHAHTWPLHVLAEGLVTALAKSAPESHREALRELLHEEVRKAAEKVTTDVGHTYLRLLRSPAVFEKPHAETS